MPEMHLRQFECTYSACRPFTKNKERIRKKDLKIYSVNTLYLSFDKVNRYFEEINRNKYLTIVPTNESKEKIKKNWGLKWGT